MMKITRPAKKPFLLLIIKRISFFLLVMCAAALWLYFLGNVHVFTDETERLLLRIAEGTGISLVFSSAAGAILTLLAVLSGKFRYLAGFAAYVLSAAIGGAASTLAAALLLAASGL